MHDQDRTANLLGATALAVSDLMLAGATAAAGTSESGAAALVVLSYTPGISVTELGRRVGLSQPAAARMVDSLDERGLVERRRSIGRWVAVHPTGDGAAAARNVLADRGGRLTELVGMLAESERAALADVLGKLLDHAYRQVRSTELLCRLCDRPACTAESRVCPVGEAGRREESAET